MLKIIFGITAVIIVFVLAFFYKDSGKITAAATGILAIITAVYVYLTHKILDQMKSQSTSDIQIDVKDCVYIGDFSVDPAKKHFKLSFDVFNQSPASGTITTPILVLEFPDKPKLPIESDFEGNLVPSQKTYSPIIYLTGGQMHSKVLIYCIPTNSHFTEIDSKNEVKSYIEYRDNLNKEYTKSITIRPGDYEN